MTRANFLQTHGELPEVRELTMAEYLAALSPTLAAATLVPLDYLDRPAEPVTLTTHNEELNNGRE